MLGTIREGLTFDDVLLVPQESSVIPRDVKLNVTLTEGIELNIPLLSAAMDMCEKRGSSIKRIWAD